MERMEKQTAVEWLESYLNNRLLHLTNNKIHIKEFVRTAKCAEIRKVLEIINQAKAMEKKNTIAFGYRCIGEVDSELGDLIYKKVPEEIYNETFKSE